LGFLDKFILEKSPGVSAGTKGKGKTSARSGWEAHPRWAGRKGQRKKLQLLSAARIPPRR